MDPNALSPALRGLRGCMHLLVLALLIIAVARAVLVDADGLGVVIGASVAMAAIYATGVAWPRVRDTTSAAALWLTAVGVAWLVLLTLSPEAVWLAFPLYFLQAHLLPTRWGVLAVGLTTAAAIGGFGWHQHQITVPMVLGPVLGAAVAVTVVLGFEALHRESEARRRLIEELTATRAELAEVEHSAGVLAERERLAREIHDTLAQGLSSIQLLLRAAQRASPDRSDSASQRIEQARQAAMQNLAEARSFVRNWTPPDLESGNLATALRAACSTAASRSGTSVNFHVSGEPVDLSPASEVALLRIAQSALANAGQHAHADRTEVTLSYMPSEVALDVVDDGVGFDPASLAPPNPEVATSGFGLGTIRARAHALSGSLSVESSPGTGTAISVTLPFEPNEWR